MVDSLVNVVDSYGINVGKYIPYVLHTGMMLSKFFSGDLQVTNEVNPRYPGPPPEVRYLDPPKNIPIKHRNLGRYDSMFRVAVDHQSPFRKIVVVEVLSSR